MADLKISQLTGATTPLAGTEVVPIVQSSTTKKVAVSDLTAGRAVLTGALTVDGLLAAKNYQTLGTQASAGAGAAVSLVPSSTLTNWMVAANYVNPGLFEIIPSTAGGGTAFSTPAITVASTGDTNFRTGNLIQGTAAKGINFTANTPAAGMTSQLLNWYEEGTWTPTLGGATTAGTYEAAAANGRYTRIGRQVTIQCYLELANVITGGGSGYAQLTGLPFAKAADGTFPTGALFTKGVDWAAGTPIVAPITSGSTSTLYFPEIIDNAPNNNIDISGFSAQDVISFTLTYNVS